MAQTGEPDHLPHPMTASANPVPHPLLGLAASLALCTAAGAIGALASVDARSFYAELSRPAWAPPGWVFGPVWSALYLSMAVAAWLVWRQPHGGRPRSAALGLFAVQLGANALWSWLFFAWRLGAVAFAEVVLLWLLVVCTVVAFWRVRPAAGLLLVPYGLWVSFATALTFAVWRGNPGLLG